MAIIINEARISQPSILQTVQCADPPTSRTSSNHDEQASHKLHPGTESVYTLWLVELACSWAAYWHQGQADVVLRPKELEDWAVASRLQRQVLGFSNVNSSGEASVQISGSVTLDLGAPES